MTIEPHLLPVNYTFSQPRYGNKPKLVVVHWTAGYSLADAEGAFKSRKVDASHHPSAHYGIDGLTVWQFVAEERTAYHASNWTANLTSIGIEHVGIWEQPVKDETYVTSGQLISQICKKWGFEPSDTTIVPHSKFGKTSCPGTLDLGRLIGEARKDYLGLVPVPPVVPPVSELLDLVVPSEFPKQVTVTTATLYVRSAPSLTAPLAGTKVLHKNDTFTAANRVSGDTYTDGRSDWYVSSLGHYVAAAYCQ